MALEAFLVNPVRGRKRKISGARKRKGGGLPSGLLSRMIRTYGIKRGMKEAWKAYRSGARNPRTLPRAYQTRVTHRPVTYGTGRGVWKRSPLATGSRLENPFGEEVMIVGNPRKGVRRRRKVRHNEPSRKRVYHRHYSMRHNEPARMRHNEPARRRVVHRKRHYRRNPASTGLAISARRPMSLLMPAAIGAGGYFAADYIPIAIGQSASPITRLGIKAAIAIGGGMVLGKFLGAKSAAAFSLGVGINVLNDVLKTYVFQTAVSAAGLGAFVRPRLTGMGAMTPYRVNPTYPS